MPLLNGGREWSHLEERPAALLVEEGRDDRDSPDLPDSVLGQLGARVAAGDVSQSTHGWLNDVLSTTGVVDCLEQSLLRVREREREREREGERER